MEWHSLQYDFELYNLHLVLWPQDSSSTNYNLEMRYFASGQENFMSEMIAS